jgi:UDP-N-acetylglucosamine 2-epimerase (non-hydrolysing)
MYMKKVAVVFGTRPEAIKLAPVIIALKDEKEFVCSVYVTAQHRELLDQVLTVFKIIPDIDFNLMRRNQKLSELTASAIQVLNDHFEKERPDMVIVQGDTTTVLSAALAAFYNKIPIGHVEAGLRTGNLYSPWPEEANRVLTSHLAAVHFAPTDTSRANLIREGIPEEKIFVTGNTIVDALLLILEEIKSYPPDIPGLSPEIWRKCRHQPLVLITGHRRENFGPGFESICRAIAELARLYPNVQYVYPVHLNPNVREPVERILRSSRQRNIHLIEPVPYVPFVALMERSTIILTDSGGIQEEAPSLGKPVLVMRDTTERPEAIEAGTARLVGSDADRITSAVSILLGAQHGDSSMKGLQNPFGDGRAAERIVDICRKYLFTS